VVDEVGATGEASISGKAKEVRQRDRVERAKPKQAEYITLTAWEKMATSERARYPSLATQSSTSKTTRASAGRSGVGIPSDELAKMAGVSAMTPVRKSPQTPIPIASARASACRGTISP
jgi:hypothetical protein